MKRKLFVVTILITILMLLMACSPLPGNTVTAVDETSITLNSSQIAIVGLVAMFLAWIVGFLIEKVVPWVLQKINKPVTIDIGRWIKTVLVGVSAAVLTQWWFPFNMPPGPAWSGSFLDNIVIFFNWLPILGVALSPYIGVATMMYNLLFGYILDPEKRKQFWAWLLKYVLGIDESQAS